MTTSISDTLAAFACEETPPPSSALQTMRLSLLDWAACGLAGAAEPVSRIVREMVLAEAGAGAGDASLFGGGQASARAAALVNGTTSHALDYDDTHFAHIGHPSVAILPAALAVAQREGAGGVAFLQAALRGVEASIRIGQWLGRDHYQIGFHQTGTAGTFGACVAAGRLLGLAEDQMTQAIGLASTKAAGLKSQFGTMGKPYNAGQAAQAGVEVSLLAREGFISAPEALNGSQGFGPTHHGQGDTSAFEDLGIKWVFETVSHKFHACCHGTHAMIEALLDVRDQVEVGAIEKIILRTHPRWLSVCNIARPQTGLEAKFSYRLIAAMVLAGQDTAALASFSDAIANDPALHALRDLVEVEGDSSVGEMQAELLVQASGGEIAERCDLETPLSLEDRSAKLQAKAASLVGSLKAAELTEVVFADDGPDVAALADAITQ